MCCNLSRNGCLLFSVFAIQMVITTVTILGAFFSNRFDASVSPHFAIIRVSRTPNSHVWTDLSPSTHAHSIAMESDAFHISLDCLTYFLSFYAQYDRDRRRQRKGNNLYPLLTDVKS